MRRNCLPKTVERQETHGKDRRLTRKYHPSEPQLFLRRLAARAVLLPASPPLEASQRGGERELACSYRSVCRSHSTPCRSGSSSAVLAHSSATSFSSIPECAGHHQLSTGQSILSRTARACKACRWPGPILQLSHSALGGLGIGEYRDPLQLSSHRCRRAALTSKARAIAIHSAPNSSWLGPRWVFKPRHSRPFFQATEYSHAALSKRDPSVHMASPGWLLSASANSVALSWISVLARAETYRFCRHFHATE